MNKYKKRYQKVNSINNKNKKLNGSDEGLNKEQNSNYILRSSTYTWQNYCKNSPWIYYLVNSIMEGSLPGFVKSYDWFFSSLSETTKDLVAFYYHPTTVYQMIPIIMGFIFSYIWDFFRVWLDLLTHGVVVVILLYKPLWKKKIIFFYVFHGLCYYLTGDIWGFKLIDYVFAWRYTLINFCENILAGSVNSDKDFLQWFKDNSENRQKQRETINSCELDRTNHLSITLDDDGTFLTMENLDTNNILFSFLSELINKYSRKFCVVGPISWVWIWILGLKIWYSSWIIENIKEIYVRFRESIEKNVILNLIHWNYLEKDDTIEKLSPPSPRNPRLPPLTKKICHSSSDFDVAKSYILNHSKVAKIRRKPQRSASGELVKSKEQNIQPKEIKNSGSSPPPHSQHPSSIQIKTHTKTNSYSNHITPTISRRTIRIKKS
ncbi:hypothetical protein PIROE2DRAFT_5536 [Piromyces sp. E2]|nr:hypothetical protein PIROE2DRAFT_5536 [Piromyces sp. E2]|eukprot:OUM67149.1 hypothetical protein PIROE2DRAFT_5536 [Piromyces sp. E2]